MIFCVIYFVGCCSNSAYSLFWCLHSLNILKKNIIKYIIISIFKKDIVLYASYFEFMITSFLLENTLVTFEQLFLR